MDRRRPTRRVLIGCFAAFGVFLLLGWVWLEVEIRRRWGLLNARTRNLIEVWNSFEGKRPVLMGQPEEGDAWEAYREAESIIASHRRPEQIENPKAFHKSTVGILEEMAEGKIPSTSVEAGTLLQALEPALMAWHHAVRRTRVKSQVRWEDPGGTASLITQMRLETLVRARARRHSDEGRYRESAELQFELAVFGHALQQEGGMLSHAMGSSAILKAQDGIVELLRHPAVDSGAATLIRELSARTPDTRFPLRNLTGDRIGIDLVYSKGGAAAPPAKLHHAFLGRLALLEILEFQDRWAVSLEAAEKGEWADLLPVIRRHEAEALQFHPGYVLPVRQLLTERRAGSARWALLQAGAAWRESEKVPLLPDPFGRQVRHAKTAEGIRIWSVGPDGRDDGGRGGWKSGDDLVLELGR